MELKKGRKRLREMREIQRKKKIKMKEDRKKKNEIATKINNRILYVVVRARV